MEGNEGLVINPQGLGKDFVGVEALNSLDLKVSEHSIFGFLVQMGSARR